MARLQPRLNLHDLLKRRSYEFAFITTYTFDAVFFERYCLDKLTTLADNPNVTVLTDRAAYEAATSANGDERPKEANLRYLLHPVLVPRRFHPKMFLFGSRYRGQLIVGSANFTNPGLTSNAELIADFEYEEGKREADLRLFQLAFSFLSDLATLWPAEALTSNLTAAAQGAPWLVQPEGVSSRPTTNLVHNLKRSILDQLVEQIDGPVEHVYVLSRYFDSEPTLLKDLTDLVKPRAVTIFTENGITTMTRDWLRHPLVRSGLVRVLLCTYSDGEKPQALHAKALIFANSRSLILYVGSANFTTPALLTTAKTGNIETGVIYTLPSSALDPQRFCDPQRTGFLLKEAGQLQNALTQPPGGGERPEIRLSEASVDNDRMVCRAEVPPEFADGTFRVHCRFGSDAEADLKAEVSAAGIYKATLRSSDLVEVNSSSTVVYLAAYRGQQRVATSNCVLLTNLLDIRTGQNVRRDRTLRQAQQGALQFLDVLRQLEGMTDEEALRTFLGLCDIPVTEAARPPRLPRFRGIAADESMRELGDRNLRIFRSLHEAATAFIERHIKKLKRHVTYGGIKGVPNFLHIWLAVAAVIAAQLDRLLSGLGALHRPMSLDEWYDYRVMVDIYIRHFQWELTCLIEDYLPALRRRYPITRIAEQFREDIERVEELCAVIMSSRDRMETLRLGRLRVSHQFGKEQVPPYNERVNYFEANEWSRFTSFVENCLLAFRDLAGGRTPIEWDQPMG